MMTIFGLVLAGTKPPFCPMEVDREEEAAVPKGGAAVADASATADAGAGAERARAGGLSAPTVEASCAAV